MKEKKTTLLAIETSCDETAAAVMECSGGLKNPRFLLHSNIVLSQIKEHAPFGGVVPNIAKREHTKHLPGVVARALKVAKIFDPAREIDALAVTVGPGLEPALWCGITYTQKLAQEWNLPVVAANHMEGHLVSPLLGKKRFDLRGRSNLRFPALALLVSGGHTELVLVKNWLEYEVVGRTLDDAAGEAFDKVARMMNLGYPGGPIISKLAYKGNPRTYTFPRPMMTAKNFDFSFSGLKTAVLYTLRDLEKEKKKYSKADIAASFEEAVVDVLCAKTKRAALEHGARTILLGGGVAANKALRLRLTKIFGAKNVALSPLSLTGDNASMIAGAAYFHVLTDDFTNWKSLAANATLAL